MKKCFSISLFIILALIMVACNPSPNEIKAEDVIFSSTVITLSKENPTVTIEYKILPNGSKYENISFVSSKEGIIAVSNDIATSTISISLVATVDDVVEIYAVIDNEIISPQKITVNVHNKPDLDPSPEDPEQSNLVSFSQNNVILSGAIEISTVQFSLSPETKLPDGFGFSCSSPEDIDITWNLTNGTITITRLKNSGKNGILVFPTIDGQPIPEASYITVNIEPITSEIIPETASITFDITNITLSDSTPEVTVGFHISSETVSISDIEFYSDNESSVIIKWDGKSDTITLEKAVDSTSSIVHIYARNNKGVLNCPNPLVVTILPSTPQINIQYCRFIPSYLIMKENESQHSISFSIYPENASLDGLKFTSSDDSVIYIDWDGKSNTFNVIRKNFDRFNSVYISAQVNDVTVGNFEIRFELPEVGIPGIIHFDVQEVELSDIKPQMRISFSGPSNEFYKKHLVFSSADESIVKVEWDGVSDFITITKNTQRSEGETEIYADFIDGVPYQRTTLKVRLSDNEVFRISTEDELLSWKEALKSNNSINAELMNSIELTKPWTPIESFYGVFEGNGYTISNLSVSEYINTNYGACSGFIGLLGRGGIIQNLNLEGDILVNTDADVSIGGLIGCANESEICNCEFSGNLTVPDGFTIGGVVGLSSGATVIHNVKSTGEINCTGSSDRSIDIGGIVGSGSGDLQNCESWMDISVSNDGSIGGVAGKFEGNAANVHYHGTINSASGTGGLIGFFREGTLKDSSFDGVLIFSNLLSYDSVGGIVASSYGTITNCSSCGSITGALEGACVMTGIGGFVGNQLEGKITNSTSTTTIDISSNSSGYSNVSIGGFIGLRYNYTPSRFYIEKCSYEGKINIKGNLPSVLNCGGFGGELFSYPGYLIGCTSNVEVLIDGQNLNSEQPGIYVGELIGYDLCAPFVACSSKGKIEIRNVDNHHYIGAGGLVGIAQSAYDDVPVADVPVEICASYSLSNFAIEANDLLAVGSIAGSILDKVLVESSFWYSYDNDSKAYGNYVNEDLLGEAHEIDDVTDWEDAIKEMNSAIEEWNINHPDVQCHYKYYLNGECLPELR